MMPVSTRELTERRRLSMAQALWPAFVAAHPEAARQASYDLVIKDFEKYPYTIQPWPTFVDKACTAELEACACAMDQVLKDVFFRYFDFDAARIAEFHQGDLDTISFFLSEPDGIDASVARVDALLTAEGFKCVEVNLGSGLGSWDLSVICQWYRDQPLIKRFAAEQGIEISWPDSAALFLDHMVAEVEEAGIAEDEVNLGILVAPPEHPMHNWHSPVLLKQAYERVKSLGESPSTGRLILFDRNSYRVEDNRVFVGNVRIHAVAEQHEQGTPSDLFRCFKAGGTVLFSGPPTNLLCDKRYLPLLSSLLETDFLEPEERTAIERFLPWTRMVTPGSVRFGEATGSFDRVLQAEKDRLVLKRVDTSSGEDVVVGPFASTRVWETTVGRALAEGNWIAQTYLPSEPMTYLHPEQGPILHDLAWGLFAIGGQYGGAFLRIMPQGGDGVINSDKGAQEAFALEVG